MKVGSKVLTVPIIFRKSAQMVPKLTTQQRLKLIKRVVVDGEKVVTVCREAKISRVLFYRLLKRYHQFGRDGLASKKVLETRKLSPQKRLEMIEKMKAGELVVKVCQDFGVSRTIFYRWLKRYEAAPEGQKLETLLDKKPKIEKHWRQTPEKYEKVVLNLVIEHPELSTHKIIEFLPQIGGKPILSNHGVQNVLRRNNLTTYAQRLTYSQSLRHPVGIDRFVHAFQNLFTALYTLPAPSRQLVVHLTLSFSLGIFLGIAILGVKGLLQTLQTVPLGAQIGLFFALIALGAGSLFFLYSLKYYFLLTLVLGFSRQVSGGKNGNGGEVRIGNVSRQPSDNTSIAAAKRLTLVPNTSRSWWQRIFGLSSSWRSAKGGPIGSHGNPVNGGDSIAEFTLSTTNVLQNDNGIRGGLQPDLSHVKLERHPFVSIHLPLYNEKRVVERLLTACTSQEYENYEVIVIDDSNDGTTEMVEKFARRWNASLGGSFSPSSWRPEGPIGSPRDSIASLQNDNSTEVGPQSRPYIKVIHRETREGYKGGALKVALENIDSRAEFVLVFDADFLPYPDTITQFLKYFQVTAGGLDFSSSSSWRSGEGGPIGSLKESINGGDSIASLQNDTKESPIAAIQGYQWHVLNKSENWITRGVRSEYAGSYVVERSAGEILGALKQIAGSVYMIRKDILDKYSWGTSLTEDFELTLKLYRDGYKVVYTPYIQTPSECVSTLKRLIRQRMRWAEGHSHNIKRMFGELMGGRWEYQETQTVEDGGLKIGLEDRRLKVENQPSTIHLQTPPSTFHHLSSKTWVPSKLTLMEKLEFLYLSPYYLQATFFIIGTLSWFLSEAVFHTKLPFWTSLWGWSLVLTNLFSLPLMNTVGLFLEESEERDYMGILSFISLSYILAPFQGYAAVKGFLERQEGPWFRTPKTGKITDIFTPGRFARFISGIFGRPAVTTVHANDTQMEIARMSANPSTGSAGSLQASSGDIRINSQNLNSHVLALNTANNQFNRFAIKPKRMRWVSKATLAAMLTFSLTLFSMTKGVPVTEATQYTNPYYLYNDTTALLTNAWQLVNTTTPDTQDSSTNTTPGQNQTGTWQYYPGTSNTSSGTLCSSSPNGRGWLWTTAFEQEGTIAQGQWTFYIYESDTAKQPVGNIEVCVYKVTLSGGSIQTNTLLFNSNNPNDTAFQTDILDGGANSLMITTTNSIGPFTFSANDYLYVEYWVDQTAGWGGGTSTTTFYTGDTTGTTDPRITTPTITIPEKAIFLLGAAPFIPRMVFWLKKRWRQVENSVILKLPKI